MIYFFIQLTYLQSILDYYTRHPLSFNLLLLNCQMLIFTMTGIIIMMLSDKIMRRDLTQMKAIKQYFMVLLGVIL